MIDLTGTPWRWLTLSVKHDIVCLVDATHWDWITQWRWNWAWHNRTKWKHYAKRNAGKPRTTLYLHRELMLHIRNPVAAAWCAEASELVVHHKNGQSLDDREDNLRWLTPEENRRHRLGEFLTPSIEDVARDLVAKWRRKHPRQPAEVPF